MADSNYAVQFTLAATLAAGFSGAFKKATGLTKGLSEETKALKEAQKNLQAEMKAAQAAMNDLTGPTDKAIKQMKQLRQAQLENYKAQISSGKQDMMSGASKVMVGVGTATLFAQPIRDAMKFESAMADVRKVVDGLDDAKAFKSMSKDIQQMSLEVPMTAEEIASLVAAGGQSGIAKGELLDFAKDAAKMGIAFDISAEQAGDMMAKWRTAFRMSQKEVIDLADKVNYLSNNTAASAPLISDVVTRIGPLAETGGLAAGEVAALGASIVGVGVPSEVAATGIKNLIVGMTAGTSATKEQAKMFDKLGFSTVDLAKRMQVDAKGAIVDVMNAIRNLEKHEQTAILKEIFGKESINSISSLVKGLENVESNFAMVADKASYTGSMLAEYKSRSETAENATILFDNALAYASTSMGEAFLPILKDVVKEAIPMVDTFSKFVSENPGVVTAIGGVTAGIIALNIALGVGQFIMGAYTAAVGILGGAKTLLTIAINSQTYAWIAQRIAMVANWLAHIAFFGILITLRGAMAIVTAAQWAFNAALSANPIGLVILAIAALIAIGVALYVYWDEVKAFFISLWESPLAAIFAFIGGPIMALLYIASLVVANWEDVKAWFVLLWNDPSAAIDQFYNFVVDKFTALGDWLVDKWESVKSFFSSPITAEVNYQSTESVPGAAISADLPEGVRPFAVGGVVSRPTMALIGEGGDEEYIIPINATARARQLWQAAGAKLGMFSNSSSARNPNSFASKVDSLTSSMSSQTTNMNSSAQFVYSPTITISGNADTSTVQKALSNGYDDFMDKISQWQRQQRRVALD